MEIPSDLKHIISTIEHNAQEGFLCATVFLVFGYEIEECRIVSLDSAPPSFADVMTYMLDGVHRGASSVTTMMPFLAETANGLELGVTLRYGTPRKDIFARASLSGDTLTWKLTDEGNAKQRGVYSEYMLQRHGN